MNPWDRQGENGELEPMLWYGRFTLYRETGSERTLLGAVKAHKSPKQTNSVPGAWKDAFAKWNWKQRAEAWDVAEIERQQEQFRADCDEWRTGRFEDARLLRTKARQLLSFPVFDKIGRDRDGEPTIVKAVSPAKLKAAASILKTADELARITTRETLPKVEIEQDNWNVDLGTLSTEQLKQLAAGGRLRDVLATPGAS